MDRKSRLTFGPFRIRGINDNGIYCRAWKKLFCCLYDHDPRPPEAKVGNLSHKSGGRTKKADFKSLPTNKTQKEAWESRNNIRSYGALCSFIRTNKMVVINIPVQLRAHSKLHPSAAGGYPSGGIIATHIAIFCSNPDTMVPTIRAAEERWACLCCEIFTNCCTAHLNRQFYGNTSPAIPFTELFFHAWKPSHVNFFGQIKYRYY